MAVLDSRLAHRSGCDGSRRIAAAQQVLSSVTKSEQARSVGSENAKTIPVFCLTEVRFSVTHSCLQSLFYFTLLALDPMRQLRAAVRLLPFVVALAFGSCVLIAQEEAPRKISLPAPGKSVRAEDRLHGMGETKQFVFHGVTGARVKIELSGAGPLRGEITFPSGHRTGSPGGIVLDEVLPESGSYRLKVSESAMGESWDGKFSVHISVAE
jgi:hypothetical protein